MPISWLYTKAGADVSLHDKDGFSPLHLAATLGEKPAIITALIEAGADIHVRDEFGRTPRELVPWRSPLVGTDACRQLNGEA